MENLGEIGITFGYADTRAELLTVLGGIDRFLDTTDDRRQQIVLIIPNAVRERLGWSKTAAPQPALFEPDLVFRPPV